MRLKHLFIIASILVATIVTTLISIRVSVTLEAEEAWTEDFGKINLEIREQNHNIRKVADEKKIRLAEYKPVMFGYTEGQRYKIHQEFWDCIWEANHMGHEKYGLRNYSKRKTDYVVRMESQCKKEVMKKYRLTNLNLGMLNMEGLRKGWGQRKD